MSVQGNLTLTNSATINNTSTNSNILSGGSVTFTNSAETVTSSGVTSNSSKVGSDISENNSSIAGESSSTFFNNFFGTSEAAMQSAANLTYNSSSSASYNSQLNGVTGKVIWINQTGGTATISNSTTIGSASQPVILIVNGNLTLSNSVTIYGIVFVMNSTSTDLDANSVTINGALGATGNFLFSNSATLNYNPSILSKLPSISGSGSSGTGWGMVPGSWRDF
jgi:hypothetical protein